MEYLSSLPRDISLHILVLLPIETVSNCALVSKSWKKLIHSSSFYEMHTVRLLHLANEAQAEVDQKFMELGESHESDRPSTQIYQSSEQLEQFLNDLVGKIQETMDSVILSETKTAYYTRLARKCVSIWATRAGAGVTRESLLEACGRNQTEIMMRMATSIQLSTSSVIGQVDADEAVAAKKPKRPAGSGPIRRLGLADFWFGSVLGGVWRKIKKKQ